MECIHLAQDRRLIDSCELSDCLKGGDSCIRWGTISFSRSSLLYGICYFLSYLPNTKQKYSQLHKWLSVTFSKVLAKPRGRGGGVGGREHFRNYVDTSSARGASAPLAPPVLRLCTRATKVTQLNSPQMWCSALRQMPARKQMLASQDWLTWEPGMSCSPSSPQANTIARLF
jgi:hypothetical protein